MKKIGVALLGLGVVGGGTYQILTSQREFIKRNDGIDIEIKCILEKNLDRCKELGVDPSIVSTDIDRVVGDPEISVVAEFFGVTEYEIRKAIKLTRLIPPLADILESEPKRLNLACAEMIAEYDAASQEAFVEICGIQGYCLNKATVKDIVRRCPPPAAEKQRIFAAWREARAAAEKRKMTPPKNISFDRKKFTPYLEKLGGDQELERLFLEFLRERAAAV